MASVLGDAGVGAVDTWPELDDAALHTFEQTDPIVVCDDCDLRDVGRLQGTRTEILNRVLEDAAFAGYHHGYSANLVYIGNLPAITGDVRETLGIGGLRHVGYASDDGNDSRGRLLVDAIAAETAGAIVRKTHNRELGAHRLVAQAAPRGARIEG